MMKRAREKEFGAKKDPKAEMCFECGKIGNFRRDCYKLKNKQKQSTQQANSRDKKKTGHF